MDGSMETTTTTTTTTTITSTTDAIKTGYLILTVQVQGNGERMETSTFKHIHVQFCHKLSNKRSLTDLLVSYHNQAKDQALILWPG